MSLNNINVQDVLSVYCVLIHNTFTLLVLLVTHNWWGLIWFLEKTNEYWKINVLAPHLTESACQSRDSHLGLFGFKSNFLLFHPIYPLWTAQQVLWTSLLFLCHFSEVHFPLSQLHERQLSPPVTCFLLQDFRRPWRHFSLCLVCFSLLRTGSQEALVAWQRVISATCFRCPVSPNCSFQTYLWYITHLPWLPLSPALQSISEVSKKHRGNSRQHQGRAETLSVRLTNWDVGKIPPRLI